MRLNPLAKPTYIQSIWLFILIAISNTTFASKLDEQRDLFLSAESALKYGKLKTYKAIENQLRYYPLYPYLRYAYLKHRIQHVSRKEYDEFMRHYRDTPLANKLKQAWLVKNAQQKNWRNFLDAYTHSENITLQCHHLWAKYHEHPNSGALDQVADIWLHGKSRPKPCDPLFHLWEKKGYLTRPLAWQRIKLAIQSNNPRLAKYLTKHLDHKEKPLVDLWLQVHQNPKLTWQTRFFKSKHPAILEILVYGVGKIARTDPNEAIKIWQYISNKHPFTERHWGLVVRSIGLTYAWQNNPVAIKWLKKVPPMYTNDDVHEWRIRVALSNRDWASLLKWTGRLPPHLQVDEKWRYWQARALEINGHSEQGQNILTELSETRSYYGFLASLRLIKPYHFHNQKISVQLETIQQLEQKPGIIRARELLAIGEKHKSNSEWYYALERMNESERQAAAIIAAQWNQPNWSILSLAKAQKKDDLSLRFPKTYSEWIQTQARKNQIDPALIFAVTRQESAFKSNARSPAGAVGLMQLLPSTGFMVAKSLKLPIRKTHQLLDPKNNIQLGTRYLKMMLDKYQNNPVLALAAYNAGPSRLNRWLPDENISADIWIETIPYKETRNYIQNILAYTLIYQELMGKKPKLSQHMPHILGANNLKVIAKN